MTRTSLGRWAAPALLLLAALITACAMGEPRPGTDTTAEHVRTVEGIEEYRLPNGMQVLLVPDQSRSSIMVNTTYFVGSRHEGYGETGMAHLLEHMLFYGTEKHPDIRNEISEKGGRANGTTWFDRTNYFQTFPASRENLEWALSMEADRMVNATFDGEDLASEMSVVRNEFEIGENNPFRVLMQRTLAAAHEWHGYGRSTIGARSDIENVPIERLWDFYRRYYQPDNAMVVVSGNFEREQALALIEDSFGRIPAPDRAEELRIWDTYTREPTQDGERTVTVRRSGDSQYLMASYHVPAGAHPDFAALDLLAHVIGNQPSGRLHKALVESELATSVGAFAFSLREPGVLLAFAEVPSDQDLDEVERIFRETLDDLARDGIDQEEATRARSSRLRALETGTLNDSERLGISLTEWSASGDWRLLFLHRDRLGKTTKDDVEAVAEKYLRRDNRTIGRFIPDSSPKRSEIPEIEDLNAMLAAHEFSEEGRVAGEAFEATPENVHARLVHAELSNGMRVSMLPKQTRGDRVVGTLVLRMGDEDSLRGQRVAGNMTAAMLMRGTRERDRQGISDRLDELQSSLSVSGGVNRAVTSIDTQQDKLTDVLGLGAEILKQPAFDESEFRELRRSRINALRDAMTQPQQRAFNVLGQAMGSRDSDHPQYAASLEEELAAVEALDLAALKQFHNRFYGAGDASLVLIGSFDPDAVLAQMESLFGDWEADVAYRRIPEEKHDPEGKTIVIRTPDRANAVLGAAHRVMLSDEHDDYPAVAMANHLIGGGFLSSRLAERIRNQEGISYGVGSNLSVSSHEDAGQFLTFAFYAPENRERLLAALREELHKVIEEGFTEEELEAGRRGWLQNREVSRGNDRELAGTINNNLAVGRDMLREAALDQAIRELDVDTLNQAARRHLKPERLTIVIAGDFDDGESMGD
ncbi:M16 family metallopeptidase [Natronospira bacteriovora]|uniref:Pitrilysin family protein n=1 Tax=Natronospira bacteriovora TaxID=3069753 RepID=A0ABU0W9Z1_9GAMM|nr:pitrilysin family protein [Natronospira sp. AB-CW4]MDQ2070733.1 pitrilysin family protein [Natronospira sp. AB-CW4]